MISSKTSIESPYTRGKRNRSGSHSRSPGRKTVFIKNAAEYHNEEKYDEFVEGIMLKDPTPTV